MRRLWPLLLAMTTGCLPPPQRQHALDAGDPADEGSTGSTGTAGTGGTSGGSSGTSGTGSVDAGPANFLEGDLAFTVVNSIEAPGEDKTSVTVALIDRSAQQGCSAWGGTDPHGTFHELQLTVTSSSPGELVPGTYPVTRGSAALITYSNHQGRQELQAVGGMVTLDSIEEAAGTFEVDLGLPDGGVSHLQGAFSALDCP